MLSNKLTKLNDFVGKLRNAKTEDDEWELINKENNKLKELMIKDKKPNNKIKIQIIFKIMYIYQLGYNIDYSYMIPDIIAFIQSNVFYTKLVGLIAVNIFDKDILISNDIYDIVQNELKLNHDNTVNACLILNCIANMGLSDNIEFVTNKIVPLLLELLKDDDNIAKKTYLLKKVFLCLVKCVKVTKDSNVCMDILNGIFTIKDKIFNNNENKSVVCTCFTLIYHILTVVTKSDPKKPQLKTKYYDDIIPVVIDELKLSFDTSKTYPKDYIYHTIRNPTLILISIKILTIFLFYEYSTNNNDDIKDDNKDDDSKYDGNQNTSKYIDDVKTLISTNALKEWSSNIMLGIYGANTALGIVAEFYNLIYECTRNGVVQYYPTAIGLMKQPGIVKEPNVRYLATKLFTKYISDPELYSNPEIKLPIDEGYYVK